MNEVRIVRSGDSFTVYFEFPSEGGRHAQSLIGVRDIDNALELLSAERLWVKRDEGSSQEFGTLILGISHESYTEIVFDALASS
ncbi:MAG: hypothetical protein V2I38_16100 [Alcanivoracaceae bacterium]|nr:hypothetical protein [Alcanivoracaceae bacterium]